MRGRYAPLAVQPLRLPVSKPPLTTPAGGAVVTVSPIEVVCVAVVPVPVTVIVYVPVAVVEPTLTVIADEPPAVTEAGLKPAEVPLGRPLALRLTVCAEPLRTAVPIVDVPLEPCATVMLDGLAEIEKSEGGAGLTVTPTLVACVAVEPVPVTVIVYVPGVVSEFALTVIVDELPALTDVGLNETVTPDGRPLADRLMLWAAPLVTAVPIDDVALPPCVTPTLLGLAEIEKSEVVTVSPTVVVCVALAPVPVTVIV